MAADASHHIEIFGLDVKNDTLYRRYREGMTPILHRYQGAFGYDFVVSEVLKSPVEARINRVFTMIFPDKKASIRFFSDPEYLKVRQEFFASAVEAVTKIAEYDEKHGDG
jgi:uncharacterized protein (DUF1330 family)